MVEDNSTNSQQQNDFDLKQLELNSLLEITQAINANMPEDSLYKIYHFTLLANLNIKKIALYVFASEWVCKVNYGTKVDYKKVALSEHLLSFTETEERLHLAGFEEFSTLIPVTHKDKPLALLLLSGNDHEPIEDLKFIRTLTNIILVAIENKKLARQALVQEAFKKEMEIARDVQSKLFPKSLPYTDTLKICATYYPHQSIGGDYYDYIPLNDDQFMICIGDVSGKGMSAALLMSNVQASLRTLVRHTNDLQYIIREVNHIILSNSKGERFITFFLALIDQKENSITYINSGHNPPLLINKQGQVQELSKGSTMLGVFEPLPFVEKETVQIDQNVLLFLYTDGVTEVSNVNGEEFGIEQLQTILKNTQMEIKDLHDKVFEDIKVFSEGKSYPDDITYVTCFLG